MSRLARPLQKGAAIYTTKEEMEMAAVNHGEPIAHDGDRTTKEWPFHAGERAVQKRLGVRESIEPWAHKVVRPWLPEEHRAFYAGLPFLVAAARDQHGRPWASILTGRPGFSHSPHERSLMVGSRPSKGDALEGAFRVGADVGLLGIELHSRRRSRLNGRVAQSSEGAFEVRVDQAFGNCPQYIREREWTEVPPSANPRRATYASLPEHARRWIENADTFFIASGYRGDGNDPAYGMDASHRGGERGFVRVAGERTLVFPDYAGNNLFNTIGNLLVDPRAGLLFVDFEQGSLLQLTGRASVDFAPPSGCDANGARRLVRFEVEAVVELRGVLPLRWELPRGGLRELRVVEKVRESDDVTSFVLEASDGRPLPSFSAGQHVPVEVEVGGVGVRRTYSLSGAPDDGRHRITVKREPHGVLSRHLHDVAEVGSVLRVAPPRGTFVLDPSSTRPVVLVSAGVGITPLVSMLHDLVCSQPWRPVWFVHGARDGRHHPFASEVKRLAERASQVRTIVAYSRPGPRDLLGRDYHRKGRVDGGLLRELPLGTDAEFHLCGPSAFMGALQQALEDRGVSEERIHTESFGPSRAR